MMAAPTSATNLNKSNLTSQLEHSDGSITPKNNSNNKLRSLSDAPKPSLVPTLSPSPAIRESPNRRVSKDDNAVADPVTPRRPAYHMRGLSLQMPNKSTDEAPVSRVPLSPKLDSASTYGSPASVLPRRSRGLDQRSDKKSDKEGSRREWRSMSSAHFGHILTLEAATNRKPGRCCSGVHSAARSGGAN